MNTFFSFMLSNLPQLVQEHPVVAALMFLLGALVFVIGFYVRFNFLLREKALTLNTKRFQTLMKILKADNADILNPLYLELAFQRAFGRRLNRNEIVFALDHNNPSDLLFDLRYGRGHVKLNPEKTGFDLKNPKKLSLRSLERIADVGAVIVIPALLFMLVYAFFEPIVGILLLIELSMLFWVLCAGSRSIACAQRLLDTDHSAERRTHKQASSAAITDDDGNDGAPKKRTRSKASVSQISDRSNGA